MSWKSWEAGPGFADEEASVLTVKQVADRLAVSPKCVYSLIEHGNLPCPRIGSGRGTIRVSEEQLRAYLGATKQVQVREEPAPAPAPENVRAAGFTILDGKKLQQAWTNR